MTKVLLVEDDNNLREIYEARLQAEGYDIVSANDGEEALVLAKNEKPDLIISDVMMPKISGFEMLDILRNTAGLEKVKVIMLTALGQADDQTRANKLGADRYLVKSQVTLEDIVKTAHELMSGEPDSPAEPAASAASPDMAPTNPSESPSDNSSSVTTPTEPSPKITTIPVTSVPEPSDNNAAAQASDNPAPEPPLNAPTNNSGAFNEPMGPGATANNPITTSANPTSMTQSTAQEEAKVKEQIEDFIGSQSQPSKQSSGQTTPAEPATPSSVANDSANAANDDKVLSEAVDTLIADAEKKNEILSNQAPEPTVFAPQATATVQSSTPPPTIPDAPKEDQPVAIAHKKIIKPLDSEPKTPLDALVAMEDAKEATSTNPTPVVSSTTDNQTQTPVSDSPTASAEQPLHAPGNIITPNQPNNSSPTNDLPGFDPNHVAL